jgi:adenosine kinase
MPPVGVLAPHVAYTSRMTILVCGSIAYDTIMVFQGQFRKHILADQMHILNVSFLVPDMRREFGGTGGNIAYNLRLLGESPALMATVGHDFAPYDMRLAQLGISQRHVRHLDDQFTAQAFITTDVDDNQITAFHPGAMSFSHLNRVADAAYATLGIVSPDGRQGMIEHARDLAAQGIPYIFDPGQGLPLFEGSDLLEMMAGAVALAVNDYEARVVERKTGRKVEDLGRDLAVFVTRAAEGSSVYADGQRIDVPAVPEEALVDPTGCGDAYRAGLLYGMARGWPWAKCAQLASVMGAIKIAHRGGQNHQPSRETIAEQFRAAFGEAL